jgi:hypothetical protein
MSTFNRATYIEESLNSILEQTLPPDQVIVVDDGSTDDTAGRLAGYGDRIHVLRLANGGKARALNAAMPLVTGAYVWIFDDDDVALPTAISSRVEVMRRHPDAGVVFARHYWGADGVGGKIARKEESTWPSFDESSLLLTFMRGCFTTLQGALIRSSSLREVGPLREELLRSQDYDILLRLVRRFPVALLDEPVCIIRRHSGARGPANVRHDSSEREAMWAKFDGLLGQALRREASLGEYLTPPVKSALRPEQVRSALLNRMSVMASKGLAAEMLEDAVAFARASGEAGVTALSESERALVVESVQQRYFRISVVPERAAFASAARQLMRLPLGRSMLRGWARGLLGLAHWGGGSVSERLDIAAMAATLAGLSVLSSNGSRAPS